MPITPYPTRPPRWVVPTDLAVEVLLLGFAVYTVVAAGVLLFVSRRVFRLALRRYRSASS